jgi:hypothetical protein
MKLGRFQSSEGKSTLGCIFYLLLFIAAVYASIQVIPVYYANLNFGTDVKMEVSRAGARTLGDEKIVEELLDLARKNDVSLEKNDIKIEHFPDELRITITYCESVNLILFTKDFHFTLKESSFVGTL